MNDATSHYENKLAHETDSWDLSEAIKKGDAVIVVDARSPEAYAREHIPVAINLPHRTMTADSTAHLDRNAVYVVYCDGIGCNASTKGALNLARLGFQVRELMGGLDWWKRDGHATSTGEVSGVGECGCG